jgi:hypothetical protein
VPGVRTFGQVIADVEDSYNYYCAQAAGRKGSTDKAALVKQLKQSLNVCNAAYGGASQVGTDA